VAVSKLDSLEGALPEPRGGEPRDLRRDILDEIGDHLTLGMEEEAAAGAGPEAARAAALERFGDPAAVARRLWFDAIKEAAMKDRVVLWAAVTALALLSIGSTIFTWLSYRDGREFNRAMLEQLRAPKPEPAAAPSSMEWTDFTVAVTREDGSAVPGVTVQLKGNPFNWAPSPRSSGYVLEESTGPEGKARFGYVRPGDYEVDLYDSFYHTINKRVIIRPGPTFTHQIYAPNKPEEAPVEFDIDWPGDLTDAGDSALLLFLEGISPIRVRGTSWEGPEYRLALPIRTNIARKAETENDVVSVKTAADRLIVGKYRVSLNNYFSFKGELRDTEIGEEESVFEVKRGVKNRWALKVPPEVFGKIRIAKLNERFRKLGEEANAELAQKLRKPGLSFNFEGPIEEFADIFRAAVEADVYLSPGLRGHRVAIHRKNVTGEQVMAEISLGLSTTTGFGMIVIHEDFAGWLDDIEEQVFGSESAMKTAQALLDTKVDVSFENLPLHEALIIIGRMTSTQLVTSIPVSDGPVVTLKLHSKPALLVLDALAREAGASWRIEKSGAVVIE
jgi:hypothetical protein